MVPASASVKISLVEDILRPNLNNVVTSNSVGNTESCNTLVVNMVIRIITIDIVIFKASSKSSIIFGNGIIIISTIPITPNAITTSKLLFMSSLFSPNKIHTSLFFN